MKIFHELVFDEFMEGTLQYVNRMHWRPVMGNFESLRLFGVAERVSATVNLAWNLQASPKFEGAHLHLVKTFTSVQLNSGQKTLFQASVPPTDPGMPASHDYALFCNLAAVAKAHVRIWVTGRGRA